MMKPLFVLFFALVLTGCSRSPGGLYQSVGSEDKFRMSLELGGNGEARFVTRSNLGNPELDRAVETSMTLAAGRWSKDGPALIVKGELKDGKPVTYRFLSQENGDLIWEKNGARLVKSR